MAYDMYLGKMLMPITPSEITMTIANKNQTITLISEGELNFLKAAGLTSIQFKVLIPQVNYPFSRYGEGGFVSASSYLDYFEQLKTSKQPFQFIVSRCMPTGKLLFDTNMTVSMENYTINESAKNGFDIEVNITLKQFIPYLTKTISVEMPSPTAPIIVNEERPIIWNPTPSTNNDGGDGSGSSSGKSKKSGGSAKKSYKVQIVGMGVVTVTASSPQEAIEKAAGSNWKGTIYVDDVAYNGATKQPDTGASSRGSSGSFGSSSSSSSSGGSSSGSSSGSSGSSTAKKVVETLKDVAGKVGGVVSSVLDSVKKALSTPSKKSTSSSTSVKSTTKSNGGTKYAAASKR